MSVSLARSLSPNVTGEERRAPEKSEGRDVFPAFPLVSGSAGSSFILFMIFRPGVFSVLPIK